jgi:hypothetical protein
MKREYVDNRNWKEYEANLIARKKKAIEFSYRRPTKEELNKELLQMNKGKRGPNFEIPNSLLVFFHFMKNSSRMDDRTLAIKLSKFYSEIMGIEREFDHSTIVKRRQDMAFDIPFGMTPEKIGGKVIYGDGVCLRLGRGGYYRSKRYKTNVDFVKVVVFTDDEGNVVDFLIGDEHDAEINMIREKMPDIIKCKPEAFNWDGAAASHDIICSLTVNGIRPIVPASISSTESVANGPPPENCIRKKNTEEKIWDNFVRQQLDYEKWRKESGYSKRWPVTEGRFSVLKRMFGEEVLTRTQKAMHDEVCIKIITMEGKFPDFWNS